MKTLVIGLNWLGDVIMSFPAISTAAKHSQLHVATRPNLAPVYSLLKNAPTIHFLPTDSSIVENLNCVKKLKKQKFDSVVVLPKSFRSAFLASLTRIPKRVGYSYECRNVLLTDPVLLPKNYRVLHESRLHQALFEQLIPDFLSSSDLQQSVVDNFEQDTFMPFKKPYVVLAPGAAFGAAKRWPPAKFAKLISMIKSKTEYNVVLSGTQSEFSLAEKIISDSGCEVFNLAGKTSLIQLASLIKNSKALIANDSGTMHLAGLFFKQTIVPCGPTDMKRTGPLNPHAVTVQGYGCSKAPCRLRECPLPSHICMNSIAAEDVFLKLLKILDKKNDTK